MKLLCVWSTALQTEVSDLLTTAYVQYTQHVLLQVGWEVE